MQKLEEVEYIKRRKALALKSMYFNRYLWVRYIGAIFFFTNLYWLLYLLSSSQVTFVALIPISMMLLQVVTFAEQFTIYHETMKKPKWTGIYFFVQVLCNNILLIISLTSLKNIFFPYASGSSVSVNFVTIILCIGILVCSIILRNLYNIYRNKDMQLVRVKDYEKTINI